jgi:hypothetical protein
LAFRHTDKPEAAKSFLPLFRVLLPDSCPKTALRSWNVHLIEEKKTTAVVFMHEIYALNTFLPF